MTETVSKSRICHGYSGQQILSEITVFCQASLGRGPAPSTLTQRVVLCAAELREAFAFSRLQMLERQVVGGEQAKNKDLKEKQKRRKKYAAERRMQLVAALQQSDEDSSDWVLLNVYDSIQEEVRAKSKLLEKVQKKVSSSPLSLLKI